MQFLVVLLPLALLVDIAWAWRHVADRPLVRLIRARRPEIFDELRGRPRRWFRSVAFVAAFVIAGPAVTAGGAQQPADTVPWPRAPRPTAPVIKHGACPFECCQYGRWTLREPAVARTRPVADARVAFRLPRGARIVADTGFVRVDTIGLVLLRHDYTDKMNGIRYVRGDSLLVLDYLGEGVFNAWVRGRAVQTEFFWVQPDPLRPRELSGEMVREPRTQWWSRIRDRRGRTGWLDMATTRVGGADACGGG